MLQHNADPAGPLAEQRDASARVKAARGAHKVHALVVGAHVLCCGVPAALMLMAAGSGAAIGVSAVARYFGGAHELIHGYELWILALSAGLVMLGGLLEWRAHRGRKVSFLFGLSALCFAANLAVVMLHQHAA
ncbi:MAG: hypothetical protein GC206_01850 [Alphaproteobacteria bacterium]|nr:hypothetical protein [Alphaproteobacteria bacterium]